MEMFRLIEAASGDRADHKIHFESPDGLATLCRQSRVFKVVDGEKLRIWYRTRRPVTCQSCVKGLEMTVRRQLKDLTGDQLEDIARHIDTFRNKYKGPAQ